MDCRRMFALTALLVLFMHVVVPAMAEDRQWSFVSLSAADKALLGSDADWKVDSKSRYCHTKSMNSQKAMAGGEELSIAKRLLFTIAQNSDGNLRFGGETSSMWLGDVCSVIIPDCKAGDKLKVEFMTSKNTATRTLSATNLDATLPTTTGKEHVVATASVVADGEVMLTVEGGMYFYSLAVGDLPNGGGTGGSTGGTLDNPDNPNETAHVFDIKQDFSQLHNTMPGSGPRIYVAPDGNDSNDGLTAASPLQSIQLAVDKAVEPGTVIVLAPGEYRPTARINIDNRNGLPDNYNAMVCLDGRAVINCNHPQHGHSDNPYQGIRLTSSYWYMYHVDITNASDNGLLIERNKPTGGTSADVVAAVGQAHDNVIDACNFYKNGDTGLQMKNLAAYNYVINCDSYLNCDEGQGDADGFAPKISVGTGNYFYGCRAYLNSDDGWDVFYKKDGNFGDNMTIILDNCIAYKNGFLDENTIAPSGNGNGFKCGSDQGAMNVYLTRCLAVMNKAKGFDQNHNSGDIILNNCTGMTSKSLCGDKTYSYRIFETIASGHKVEINNCIAINDNDEKDKRQSDGTVKASEYGKNGNYGRLEINEDLAELTVNNGEFHRSRPEFFYSMDDTQLIAPRVDDMLPEIAFAHINPEASASYSYNKTKTEKVQVDIKASEILCDRGILLNSDTYTIATGDSFTVRPVVFNGNCPDLGAYESAYTAADGIENTVLPGTTGNNMPCKMIVGNRVVIVRNGKAFTIAGQEL